MRLNEIASLKHSDIITVDGIRCLHIPAAKSKAGIRDIPIHSRLDPIIDSYLNQNHGEFCLNPPIPSPGKIPALGHYSPANFQY